MRNLHSMTPGAIPIIYDALIVGGGPAGLSAALALARVCRSFIVFDSRQYCNHGVKEMHISIPRWNLSRVVSFHRTTADWREIFEWSVGQGCKNCCNLQHEHSSRLQWLLRNCAKMSHLGRNLVLSTRSKDTRTKDVIRLTSEVTWKIGLSICKLALLQPDVKPATSFLISSISPTTHLVATPLVATYLH